MTVAVRLGLLHMPDVRLGAAATALVAFGVALAATPFGSGETTCATLRSSRSPACSRPASRSCSSRSPSATRVPRGHR